jgi:Glycosyl transferase family 2
MSFKNTPKESKSLLYTETKASWIGGPGTLLPTPLESFFSWSLAISCLTISGYHYVVAMFIKPTLVRWKLFVLTNGVDSCVDQLPCWLPLTTTSRREVSSLSALQRYQQFLQFLQKTTEKLDSWTDQDLVSTVRTSVVGRHLVTLLMQTEQSTLPLHQQLVSCYPDLLRLPPPSSPDQFIYDVSIIIPAYREQGIEVKAKLDNALTSCQFPGKVEVVIVDAGKCIDLEKHVSDMTGWGSLKIVVFTAGGGRGPCLNFGAACANGRLYTFCHSDTTLPEHWDTKIVRALDDVVDGWRANSCAFSFGIDTSPVGLNGGPYPPGIIAIQTTANIRTHLYSLPYGDQVLSVPSVIFEFLGGFPDQCLMEDYELVSLLRRRRTLLSKFGVHDKERLVIIGGAPAMCSPRRWQKFGVLYVTFMNSKFVNLYAGGMTPNDLFTQYYGCPPPKRSNEHSPWELKLEALIQDRS